MAVAPQRKGPVAAVSVPSALDQHVAAEDVASSDDEVVCITHSTVSGPDLRIILHTGEAVCERHVAVLAPVRVGEEHSQ